MLAKVPAGALSVPDHDLRRPCRAREEHNVRRYRIAIAGDGYRGLLASDRTRIPGLVSIYDIEPTVEALDDGRDAAASRRATTRIPRTSCASSTRRLTDAHDSRGPRPRTSSSASARSSRCSRSSCARLSGDARRSSSARSRWPAALALSALEVTAPAHGRARAARGRRRRRARARRRHRARGSPSRPLCSRSSPSTLLVLASSQETSSLAAFGPHPGRRRPLLRDLEPGRDAAPRARACSAPRCSGTALVPLVGAARARRRRRERPRRRRRRRPRLRGGLPLPLAAAPAESR